jgi:signal transduction histidine kinase
VFGNLSFRYKAPISVSVAILSTGLVFRNSVDLGSALSNTLIAAIKHDDVWQGYEVLSSDRADGREEKRLLMLLGDDGRVFVSSQPNAFPLQSELRLMGPELARLKAAVMARPGFEPFTYELRDDTRLYVIIPMIDDGIILGTLVMGYPRTIFRPRLLGIVNRVALSILVVMAVLVPIGWYVGNRTVSPLLELARCMEDVPRMPLEEIRCAPVEGDDEIGQLGIRFREMVQELEQKQVLERQMVVSERLAALGRLAAGVAHEINNPLGGMLNAINTFHRYGKTDPLTNKTLSLLQRGLAQIQETVSVLLVEAKAESHELQPEDVDDVRTLVQAEAQRKSLKLVWQNDLSEALPVPSTPVRQVLLNLSLNAVQAASEGGIVFLRVVCARDLLDIQVQNDGQVLPEEEMGRLFEPFAHLNADGTGLGLWVTYQIVQQLNGEILVVSEAGTTCFTVHLPLEAAA